MAAASTYTANKMLDLILNGSAFTPPTVYMGLFTSDAGLADNDAGSQTEVTGFSYARVNASSAFGAASAGSCTNSDAEIQFPTASGTWGTVTHCALLDAASGGNVLLWGAVDTPQEITAGEAISFLTSSSTWTIA